VSAPGAGWEQRGRFGHCRRGSTGLPGVGLCRPPRPSLGCSGEHSGPSWMAATGQCGEQRWGRGAEAGVPAQPAGTLTGVGDSGSRSRCPWRGRGTGLHRSVLSAADESCSVSSGVFGCSLWGRDPSQCHVASDACPLLASVLGGGRAWTGGLQPRSLPLHLCTTWACTGGKAALGTRWAPSSWSAHGASPSARVWLRRGDAPAAQRRGARALSLPLPAFGTGDACDRTLRYV